MTDPSSLQTMRSSRWRVDCRMPLDNTAVLADGQKSPEASLDIQDMIRARFVYNNDVKIVTQSLKKEGGEGNSCKAA